MYFWLLTVHLLKMIFLRNNSSGRRYTIFKAPRQSQLKLIDCFPKSIRYKFNGPEFNQNYDILNLTVNDFYSYLKIYKYDGIRITPLPDSTNKHFLKCNFDSYNLYFVTGYHDSLEEYKACLEILTVITFTAICLRKIYFQ